MSKENDPQPVDLVQVGQFVSSPEECIDNANATGRRAVLMSGHGRFLFLVEPLAYSGDSEIDGEQQ